MKIVHSLAETPKGAADIYELINSSGASVKLSSLGAGILEVKVPDSHNNISNVALGYADPADYLYDGPCMGKTPGRYANRIARGRFTIDGVEYQLAINNGPNALHGGPEGFQNQLWKSMVVGENSVTFTLESKDGDEGYPGNLKVSVTYSWTEDNQLTIHYIATTDKPTVINLTNHSYWNLRGENTGSALGHNLMLDCDHYLPTDSTLVPTGDIAPVKSSPMDFTTMKSIGEDIKKDFPALNYGKGYDNCWVINNYQKGKLAHAATLSCWMTGRYLDVYTTQPAVQVYSGNWLEGCPKSVSGNSYSDYDGIAIECQNFPDAPNRPEFPSAVLRPGEVYDETIKFVFTVKGE